jgi:DNA-binding beta-propeller fold protein YncE
LPLKPANARTVYEPVAGWAKVPHGIWLREATSVAVDSGDRVYVFNRGNWPVLVFDSSGNLIDRWGNDDPYGGFRSIQDPYGNTVTGWAGSRFKRPHAITIDHEDNLWLVDDVGCRIYKCDRSGRVLMTIGSGVPAPRQSGEMFNKPTDVAVSPVTGDLFISDGYGNSRVHRLDSKGRHILSWGEPGTDPGKFSLPHNIAMFGDSHVVVCDRENHRVQVFTTGGKFVREWHAHKAVSVFAGRGADTNLYVAEQGPAQVQKDVPNIGHCVRIWDREGNCIQRIGAPLPGEEPGQFLWPHSVAVDSRGDIYVAEVSYVEVGRHLTPPREMASLRKWRRVSG